MLTKMVQWLKRTSRSALRQGGRPHKVESVFICPSPNPVNRFFISFLALLFLESSATAQQRATSPQKVESYSCVAKQPKHEAGTPKISNFCECIPKGGIYADPASVSGEVDVQFDVDTDGALIAVRLLKSSGFKILDRYVMKAVPNCRFEPAIRGGKAIRASLIQRYIVADSDKVGENGEGLFVENGPMK